MRLSPRAAAGVGYLTGTAFFALNFSWFGETAGALLGPFGILLDLGPALVEATAFALAAAITALAAQRLRGIEVALVAAAGFSLAELLRSSGVLGTPLYQIGAVFVDTPLAPIAAFGGVSALTFVIALAGAALGAAAIAPNRNRAARELGTVALGIGVATLAAWWAWPARHVLAGTTRVAAVQGNIRQAVKWEPASLPRTVARYTALTAGLRAFAPRFILWPETVITTDLALDPALASVPQNAELAATAVDLRGRFGRLARSLNAVLAVGSVEATAGGEYNALFFFDPDGAPPRIYRKRQLVPFAEFLPGPAWLRALPFAGLVSDFGAGTDNAPIGALRIAPLICWEAGFSDLAQLQAANGAGFYAIATDDAWFGDTDGPYAQAQLAQVRAIETGRWIVRAAATGISEIVAPTGRVTARSGLDTQAVVTGTVGRPQPTVYSRLGPWPIGAILALIIVGGFVFTAQRPRA
jgi:apolipoprotein N-acyltransferase